MKKIFSLIISFSLILTFSSTALATNNTEKNFYIPSPSEIQATYEQLTTARTSKDAMIESVLSDSSDFSDRPLLQLGVLSSFAESKDDLSILIAASSIVTEEIIPNLTAIDYISLLANDGYTDSFKFSLIDAYSYADASIVTRNSANLPLVDEELVSFVLPNSNLSIIALTSIQDRSTIGLPVLTNLFDDGTEAEKQSSLKFMVELYPAAAVSYTTDILSSNDEFSALYRSAINFIPSLVKNSDVLTEKEALQIISNILTNTENDLVKITCIQALQKLNSAAAAAVVSSNVSTLPDGLIEYYNIHSDFDVATNSEHNLTPYSSTNRLANAIYRDGVAVIEYHAGLVAHSQGPEYDDTGKWIIHASGASGSVVEYAKYDPDFLNGKSFVGEYYMSGMTYSDQLNIFYTAVDLTNNSIGYTLFNLFTTDLSSGTISPSDINKMRCDGVVEYSYEYNGIKVLGGSTNWNCSTVSGLNAHSGLPKAQSQAFNCTYE